MQGKESYVISVLLNVHPDSYMPHVLYDGMEDVDELIRISVIMYEGLGKRLNGMSTARLEEGWWILENKKISCILDKKETPTALDFSAFDDVDITDPFDCDTELVLTSHGRTSTVASLKDEILGAAANGFSLPNPDDEWDLGQHQKTKKSKGTKAASSGANSALSHADVNAALGVTKSGLTGALEARLKKIKTVG